MSPPPPLIQIPAWSGAIVKMRLAAKIINKFRDIDIMCLYVIKYRVSIEFIYFVLNNVNYFEINIVHVFSLFVNFWANK